MKDPEGNPIAGAEVDALAVARRPLLAGRASDADELRRRLGRSPAARSGADGRFELKGVPAGDWAFTAKAPGWATEIVDPLKLVRDDAPRPGRRRPLAGGGDRGLSSSGRRAGAPRATSSIVRPSGKPPTGGVGLDPGRMPTGPDGAFFLDGLKAGETLRPPALRPGGDFGQGRRRRGSPRPPRTSSSSSREPAGSRASAVDGKTGQPLTAFEVSYQPDRGGFGGASCGSAGAPGDGPEARARRSPSRPRTAGSRSRTSLPGSGRSSSRRRGTRSAAPPASSSRKRRRPTVSRSACRPGAR